MKCYNCSEKDLRKALATVNERFKGNITLQVEGDSFKLGTKDFRGPGGRLGKRLPDGTRRQLHNSACWHAHGYFFEALLKANPEVQVQTLMGSITKEGGNWRDAQVTGDTARYSELCKCKFAPPIKVRVKRAKGLAKDSLRPGGMIGKLLPGEPPGKKKP